MPIPRSPDKRAYPWHPNRMFGFNNIARPQTVPIQRSLRPDTCREDDLCKLFADGLAGAAVVGVGPVGQQDQVGAGLGVADEAGAGVTRVTEGMRRGVRAFHPGVAGTDVEAVGPAVRLGRREHLDRGGTENSFALPDAAVEQHPAEDGQIGSGGEQAALPLVPAISRASGSCTVPRNGSPSTISVAAILPFHCDGGLNRGVRHPQRGIEIRTGELIDALTRDNSDDLRQRDVAQATVPELPAGLGLGVETANLLDDSLRARAAITLFRSFASV